jgi:hypothetical protein
MLQKYYAPPLASFLVCALYHQAKQLGIPMTPPCQLFGLKDSIGWQKAQEQQAAMRVGEGITEYKTK